MKRIAIAGALLATLGACEGILDVEPASRIPADELENPANAALLVNGAVADFECGFGAYVVLGGLVGEELVDATQTADRFPYDSRNVQPSDRRYSIFSCESLGVYTPLATARSSADNALRILEGATDDQVPDRAALTATAAAYAGYSLVLLGEGFCSGTISSIEADGEIVYGTELSRAELFAAAEDRFTQAIAAAEAAGDDDLLNAAYVGRARTRLNLGRYADARVDALLVPPDYVRNASASAVSDRRENRVWDQNSALSTSTSVGEPYRNFDDPRVPVVPVLTRGGAVQKSVTGIPLYRQLKYPDAASPIPLATGDEARLIVAEADARAGELESAIAIINDFRLAAGQPAFSSSDPPAVLNEIVDQRRRELFLESQHLGDVIRYDIDLMPQPGTPYHGGGVYGESLCLPLPDVERANNPNL